jgi:hypothetical protein
MEKRQQSYRRFFIGGLLVLLLQSCGIKSYRTFGQDDRKVKVYSDELIDCKFSQVIYDHSSDANIYVVFDAKTDNEVELSNVTVLLGWFQKGNKDDRVQDLKSTTVRIFKNGKNIADSTFLSNQIIPDNFKTISGKGNSISYALEFRDTTFKVVPKTVTQMTLNFIINTKSKITGKLDEHKETIKLKMDKHSYFWFLRDC